MTDFAEASLTAKYPSPARRRTPPRGISTEFALIGRSLRHAIRDVESMLMAVALPVLLMLMFTFVFGGAIDPSGDYVNYIVPGIILTCAGFGAASTSLSVANDMTSGFIDRLRTMPVRSSGVITGHVVASVVKNLFATGIVFSVAVSIGFRPSADVAEWVAVIALITLYIFTITYLFAGIGLAAKSAESANGYGFVLLFLPYVSSAFVPVETMPGWLTWFADNQPITPIIDALRSLLVGTNMGDSALLSVVWCVAILAISIVWTAQLFTIRAGRR